MKNIRMFDIKKEYFKFKYNNKNYIDIKSNFGNVYILRDKDNIITKNIVEKYNLIDITGEIINMDTGEVKKDIKKYLTDDIKLFINNNPDLQFICLGNL